MIRFLPDTWRDALLRPLAMAAPDAGVYVELSAPDFRFAFILALLLTWTVLAFRRKSAFPVPLRLLLALTTLAFIPWLVTSGNGRYFIPFLLVAGPLCIALLHYLPVTRRLRCALAVLILGWQGLALYENDPWRWSRQVSWGEGPAFLVNIPQEIAAQPATYVTLASLSYSVLAPRFHPDSRWINISSQRGLTQKSPDALRTQALIAAPGPLRLVFPSQPGGEAGGRLGPELGAAIDGLIARQGISIEDRNACRLLPSASLQAGPKGSPVDLQAGEKQRGFWLCPLARTVAGGAPAQDPVPPWIEEVFAKLEKTCPRIFRPREAISLRIAGGAVRGYPSTDFKLYVLHDGEVSYKYVRALNPVNIGKASEVMAPGFAMECENIKGRTGLPWERGI